MKYTKKTMKKKPYKKKTTAKKGTTTSFIKKVVQGQVMEKKRFYIAPIALTNGDITCSAPYNAYFLGGTQATLIQPFPLGQQTANTGNFGITTIGGWASIDITPHPAEGNTFSTREGSSITLMSSYMRFQFQQQSSNTLTPIKIRMTILKTRGAPDLNASQTMLSWYLNSALPNGTGIGGNQGIVDYNSNVSPDYRNQYEIIYTKTITLWQDNIDAGLQVKEHTIKLKYNKGLGHKIRFIQNSQTITDGQLTLLLTCDAGNVTNQQYVGPGFATLVNNAGLSGAACNFNICHYYVDA